MTNWDKIKSLYPKADKNFIIQQFGIVINRRKTPILVHCTQLKCVDCIFNQGECTAEIEKYLEKGVDE